MRRAPTLQGSLGRLGPSIVTRGGDAVGGPGSAGAGPARSSGPPVGASGRPSPVAAASAWLSSTGGVMSKVPSASGSGSAARPSPLGDPGSWGRGAGACELSFRPGCPSRSSMSGEAMLAGSAPVDRFSRVASFNSGCRVSPLSDAGPFRPSSLPACASLAPSSSCDAASVSSRAPATSAPCSPALAVPAPSGRGSTAFEPSPANAPWFPSSSSRVLALAGSDGATVISGAGSCSSSSRSGCGSLRSSRLAGASLGSSSSCRGAVGSSRASGSASGRAGSTARRSFLSPARELERRPPFAAVRGLAGGTAPRSGARRNTRTRRPIKRTGAVRSGPPSRFRKLRIDIGSGQRTTPVTHGSAKILGHDKRGISGLAVGYQGARSRSGSGRSSVRTTERPPCGFGKSPGRSVIGSGPKWRCETAS